MRIAFDADAIYGTVRIEEAIPCTQDLAEGQPSLGEPSRYSGGGSSCSVIHKRYDYTALAPHLQQRKTEIP